MSQSKKEMMNRALSAMTMNIGKAGVNDNVIEEIKRQLKANEIVKLKFAKNIAKNKDDYIADIVQKTRSKLIDVIKKSLRKHCLNLELQALFLLGLKFTVDYEDNLI